MYRNLEVVDARLAAVEAGRNDDMLDVSGSGHSSLRNARMPLARPVYPTLAYYRRRALLATKTRLAGRPAMRPLRLGYHSGPVGKYTRTLEPSSRRLSRSRPARPANP